IIGGQTQLNYDGDQTQLQGHAYFGGDFLNYWGFHLFFIHRPTTLDDQLTRGGPVVERNGIDDASIGIGSDSRQSVVGQAYVEASVARDEPGQEVTTQLSLLVKPVPNVSFNIGPTLDVSRTSQQYDTAVAATNLPEFYN